MSRKRKAPRKKLLPDPKLNSLIVPKLINSLMIDGKKTTAEKIVYAAIDKLQTKTKEKQLLTMEKLLKINYYILNP